MFALAWDTHPSFGTEFVRAVQIDSDMVRRDALAVESVNAPDLAEVVARGPGVNPILGERALARQQPEPIIVDLRREHIPVTTHGSGASGEFRKVGLDLQAHGSAVA
jgi:hypothetical protein